MTTRTFNALFDIFDFVDQVGEDVPDFPSWWKEWEEKVPRQEGEKMNFAKFLLSVDKLFQESLNDNPNVPFLGIPDWEKWIYPDGSKSLRDHVHEFSEFLFSRIYV